MTYTKKAGTLMRLREGTFHGGYTYTLVMIRETMHGVGFVSCIEIETGKWVQCSSRELFRVETDKK